MDYLKNFFEENRTKIFVVIGFIIFILGGWGIYSNFFVDDSSNESIPQISSSSVSSSEAKEELSSSETKKMVYVDVKGAVRNPGVYKVLEDKRIGFVIKKAGGLTEDADINQINLAKKINDQMLIYVYRKGEKQVFENSKADLTESGQNAEEKINLNQATKEQLTQIPGIGDKRAEQIIAYKKEHGSFKSIDELKNISGIGDKTIKKLAEKLSI